MDRNINLLIDEATEELTEDKLPDGTVEEMARFAREFRKARNEKRLLLNELMTDQKCAKISIESNDPMAKLLYN